jgi:signal transduction histidine kinase
MFDRIFSQSSGRVVAIARLSLAALFLIATLSDPSISPSIAIELVLSAYLAFAAIVAWAIWSDWWIDMRIAAAAHVTDIVFFMVVVLWPEGYASRFFLFFVFLLLSAAIRWGWRATAVTAAAVIPLYLAAGLLIAQPAGPTFEWQRFIIRSGYLVVLSAILIWFGLRRRFATGALLAEAPAEIATESEPPFHAALRHARQILKAESGLGLWTLASGQHEAFAADGDDIVRLTLTAAATAPPVQHAFLFSAARDRALLSSEAPHPRFRTATALVPGAVLDRIQPHDGLAIPVDSPLGRGFFIFWSIDGLHSDHLEFGDQLSGVLAQLIEHRAFISERQEGAVVRERMSLARDLHDGIVQFLAGSTYRIEAISRSVGDRPEVAANLQELKELMLLEQEDLRTSIAALRTDIIGLSRVTAEARALCERLARHWQIDCKFEDGATDVAISARLHLDILQIIREAVANAARHSSAKTIDVTLRSEGELILLTITDDGASAGPGPESGPWSIRERVQEADGSVSMTSDEHGTKLSVQFPLVKDRA